MVWEPAQLPWIFDVREGYGVYCLSLDTKQRFVAPNNFLFSGSHRVGLRSLLNCRNIYPVLLRTDWIYHAFRDGVILFISCYQSRRRKSCVNKIFFLVFYPFNFFRSGSMERRSLHGGEKIVLVIS